MTFPSFTTSGSAVNGINGINVAFPATVNANDMAFMLVETANQPIATPSGWGVVGSAGVGTAGATDAVALQVFWYRCDGSEDGTTVALPDAGDHILAQILCYQDVVTSGDPINAVATDTLTPAASTVTFPGLTTTASDCKVFQSAARSRDSSSTIDFTSYANTDLTGTQKQREAGTSSGNGGGFASCDGNKATAGAVGTGTCNLAGASVQAMVSFAVMSTTSVGSGGGTATGTLAASEGADTASLAGDVLIEGTLALSEANDTASMAGDVLIDGALAASEANDTLAATGIVVVRGTLALSEANDTAALTGNVPIDGALAASEGADVAAFSGASVIAGTLAASETNDTAALTGVVLIQGTFAATEANDTIAMSGASVVVGSFAASEGADVAALVGNVPIRGVLSANDNPDTAAMAGTVPVSGAAAASEEADTGSFGGLVLIQGGLAASEASDTAAFTSLVIVFDFGDNIWTPTGVPVWKPTRSGATWGAQDANEMWIPRSRSA